LSLLRALCAFSVHAPPPLEIHPLSLPDALPILRSRLLRAMKNRSLVPSQVSMRTSPGWAFRGGGAVQMESVWFLKAATGIMVGRSEEHTSELQSRENLVCRLLLEKKNRAKHPGP